MATIVLVHGAWHGGWCWRRVSDLLRTKGHDVYTPTLTGLGERSHLLTQEVDLDTHITDVANLLKFEDLQDVVLCGHSYGGMVITGAMDQEANRIAALVYLDAFLPANGDSAMNHVAKGADVQNRKLATEQGDGWRMPTPSMEMMGVVEQADIDWVQPLLVEHPLKTFEQPISLTGEPDNASRHYILASDRDATHFAEVHARLVDEPDWLTYDLHTGHDVMVTMPAELAEILDDIAG